MISHKIAPEKFVQTYMNWLSEDWEQAVKVKEEELTESCDTADKEMVGRRKEIEGVNKMNNMTRNGPRGLAARGSCLGCSAWIEHTC